jgi:tetratricopeptide (TPR) repeat protein
MFVKLFEPQTFARVIAMTSALLPASGAAAWLPGDCTERALAGSRRVCASSAPQVSTVARPADPKNQFVNAIRQFLEAVAGQYGDEGIKARAALDAMDLALTVWDKEINEDEAAAASQAQTADLHGALGLIYLDRRRIADAVREFSAAARLNPKRPDIRTFLGFAYSLSDRPAEAVQAFAEAASLDPGDAATWYRLAQALAPRGQPKQIATARQQFRESQQKNLTQASSERAVSPPFVRVDLLQQVAGIAPLFPPAVYADGFAALKQGRYRDAVTLLRKGAEIDPLTTSGAPTEQTRESAAILRDGRLTTAIARLGDVVDKSPRAAESHRILGMAYWADEQYDNAVDQFRAAIRLRPGDERSRLALADVLVLAGNLADAEQALKETIRAIPTSGQAHYNLGRLCEFQQRWSETALEFETAGNLNPVVGLDHLNAATAHACLAQPDHMCAIQAATKRVEVNPNNGDAHRGLGEIYLQIGEDEDALTELLAALLVNPRDAESFAGMAQIHLRTGRYQEAIEASQRALALNPMHGAAQFALGSALTRVGRTDEGARALERFQQGRSLALEQEQRDWDLKMLNQEVSVRLANGDDEAAIAALRKAVEYEPGAASSYVTLGRMLKKVGRYREAVESLTKASDLKTGPEVYRLLADTYDAAGEPAEAEKYRAAYQRSKEERLRTAGWSRWQ